MKIRILTALCTLAILMSGLNSSSAASHYDPALVVADTVIVRPLCFAATIIGSVFFVVSLPVAATSGSVHTAADVLVVSPARATFTRPLGDLEDLTDF
jgi:hypothetical protein